MDRNELISLAVQCRGEYFRILRALRQGTLFPGTEEVPQNCLTILDKEYPDRLRSIPYPPFVLFYHGDLSLLKKEAVSVVGSRKPCSYALEATSALCHNHLQDKVIVSGLASGIDARAHLSAVHTIGILGCGIDRCYPAENKELIRRLAKEQLILSEYPDNCEPFACHFPFRNRLIAALGQEVYVMQCSHRSGTMTTVTEALRIGREVYCLPYRWNEAEGEGCNLLLSEGAGFIDTEMLTEKKNCA